MIDDEDSTPEVRPRRYSWWLLGSIVVQLVSNVCEDAGIAWRDFANMLASHSLWQEQQREFADEVVKFIETIPVIEDKEGT